MVQTEPGLIVGEPPQPAFHRDLVALVARGKAFLLLVASLQQAQSRVDGQVEHQRMSHGRLEAGLEQPLSQPLHVLSRLVPRDLTDALRVLRIARADDSAAERVDRLRGLETKVTKAAERTGFASADGGAIAVGAVLDQDGAVASRDLGDLLDPTRDAVQVGGDHDASVGRDRSGQGFGIHP